MDIPEKNISEILNKNPSQETLHILLPLLMEEGKPERVIRECLKSLTRYPEDYTIRKILAEAYFADGKLPEAEAEADKVINSIEKLAESYRLKADILISQKREREAVEYLERFILFSPADEKAASLLNSIQESMEKDAGESPRVIEVETDELMQEEQDNRPEVVNTEAAEEYVEKEKIEDDVDMLNKLPRMNPEDGSTRKRLDEFTSPMPLEDTIDHGAMGDKKRKKEKLIEVLNAWRSSFKEDGELVNNEKQTRF